MAKINIEVQLTREQIIDALNFESWNLNELISVQAKLTNAMLTLPEQPMAEVTTQKRTKTKRKTTKYGCKKWSDQDKERLKQRFLKYKGNVTEKRLDILARRFKRTPMAIKCQIRDHHEQWLALLADPSTPVMKKQKKKQKKSKKVTAWMTKVHNKAHELKEADNNRKNYSDYVVQASQMLKGGDAHTQPDQKGRILESAEKKDFPRIYPLSAVGNEVLEGMLINLIATPGKQLNYDVAKNHLNLTDGYDWSYTTWENLLGHIHYAHKQMIDYFGITGSFVVAWDKGKKVLSFKKRGK